MDRWHLDSSGRWGPQRRRSPCRRFRRSQLRRDRRHFHPMRCLLELHQDRRQLRPCPLHRRCRRYLHQDFPRSRHSARSPHSRRRLRLRHQPRRLRRLLSRHHRLPIRHFPIVRQRRPHRRFRRMLRRCFLPAAQGRRKHAQRRRIFRCCCCSHSPKARSNQPGRRTTGTQLRIACALRWKDMRKWVGP